jgi:hypothetical protein
MNGAGKDAKFSPQGILMGLKVRERESPGILSALAPHVRCRNPVHQ